MAAATEPLTQEAELQTARLCMPLLPQARELEASDGISCEVIDLQTLLPWDAPAVEASVGKTGR